jgi:hypothetical protein
MATTSRQAPGCERGCVISSPRRAPRARHATSVRLHPNRVGTYVCVVDGRWTPRRQGDAGEFSAMLWLRTRGATVFIPVGHTPSDYDLIADFGDGAVRVQVKTSTCWRNRRWNVTLATRGGNRSWSGLVKRIDASRCDYLFAHAGDGRRWYIPISALDGTQGSSWAAGNTPNTRWHPASLWRVATTLIHGLDARLTRPLAGFPSGQRGRAVNALAQPSQVRILPPPFAPIARSATPSEG